MSSATAKQKATASDDKLAPRQVLADVAYLHHKFGDLSIGEMDIDDVAIYKKEREHLRLKLHCGLSLPTNNNSVSFAVPEALAAAASSWIEANLKTPQEAPTKKYSPIVVRMVTDSIYSPMYNLPDKLSNGKTAIEVHVPVFLCAVEMSMEALELFALKFTKATLAKDGLTPEQLRNLVQDYGLFKAGLCQKAVTVPPYHKVMCTFATHIVAHEEDFDGTDVYGDLSLTTKGCLGYYINLVKKDVKTTIRAIKKDKASMDICNDNESVQT